jgi:hypothetical protein
VPFESRQIEFNGGEAWSLIIIGSMLTPDFVDFVASSVLRDVKTKSEGSESQAEEISEKIRQGKP